MAQTSVFTTADIKLSLSWFINAHLYSIWAIVWSLEPQAQVGMTEQLIPEDNPQDDTDHHKNIRRLTEQPIEIIDGRDFSQDEVRRQIIEYFNPRKAPGPDGITSDILTLVFKIINKT